MTCESFHDDYIVWCQSYTLRSPASEQKEIPPLSAFLISLPVLSCLLSWGVYSCLIPEGCLEWTLGIWLETCVLTCPRHIDQPRVSAQTPLLPGEKQKKNPTWPPIRFPHSSAVHCASPGSWLTQHLILWFLRAKWALQSFSVLSEKTCLRASDVPGHLLCV